MSNVHTLADRIGALVGGVDNVGWLGSCTTRLRFVVRDESQVDLEALSATPGVLTAVKAGGQVQVVIGTHVDKVRDALLSDKAWRSLADGNDSGGGTTRRRPLDVVFDFLGGTFQPLIAPITGAAMVQVVVLLLTQFQVLDPASPTALILTATGNSVFYFLPIFVAFTASRKLGVNPFVGAAIGAALLHPSFTGIGETGSVAEAFGLPLFMYSYASTMFPALLVALALAGLDRLLKRILPVALQQVFVPTIELILLVPITALLFGPVGVIVGTAIGTATTWLSTTAPFLFYLIVPALWVFLVSMGIHWALISLALAEIATGGASVILGAGAGYQYAMMGIALGMLIKTARDRKKELRASAAAASIAVVIGGITEPTLYGFVLRYRRLLFIEMIAAAASGAVLGLFGAAAIGFAPAPILALPLLQPIAAAILALVVGVVVPIVLIQLWGYESKTTADAAEVAAPSGFRGAVDTATAPNEITITAPLQGEALPLDATGEPVFGGGLIGPGLAIRPTASRVVSPADGVVVAAPPSAHAIGLRFDNGLELLVHVGIDTVKLAGRHFDLRVEQGDRVTAGQVLLEFDAAAITAAGFSLVTPVVVTNATAAQTITATASGLVDEGAALYVVRSDAG